MIITLTEEEIKKIILNHINNNVINKIKIEDIECDTKNSFSEWIASVDIKDNASHPLISSPKCPRYNCGLYSRCISLGDYEYCMRVRDVC